MLVLSRYPHERILIGDDIIIEIVHVKGECVRIGIEAPKSLAIDRAEVRERPDYRPRKEQTP
jgi:carbon storage regulator